MWAGCVLLTEDTPFPYHGSTVQTSHGHGNTRTNLQYIKKSNENLNLTILFLNAISDSHLVITNDCKSPESVGTLSPGS